MTDPAAAYPSLVALSDAIAAGALKPSAVVAAHLDRIAARDGEIGAFQAVYAEDALAAAEAADRAIASGARIGPFHGLPFALKDIIDVSGRVTTHGAHVQRMRVSSETGPLARRLIAAGGVLLGKTKTVEFAFGGWGTNQRMGTPLNPCDRGTPRVPGGSSSGSGAAVAADLAPCAVGTDTGGSVRLPAAFCGIVGVKVTEGRLPLEGIAPLSPSLDTPGPMARSVADALLMLEAMDGREGWAIERDRAAGRGLWGALGRGVAGMRIGAIAEMERADCDAEVLAAYDAALEALRGLGAEIVALRFDDSFAEMTAACGEIIGSDAYARYGALYEDPAAEMDEDVRARVRAAARFSGADRVRAEMRRADARSRAETALSGVDAIATPTAAAPPIPLSEVDQNVSPGRFTRPFNYLGMCAVSLPMGVSRQGLPMSLQIAARGGDEATALRVAAAYERGAPPIPRPRFD